LNIQSPLSLRERVRARAFKKFNLWRHKVYFDPALFFAWGDLEANPAPPNGDWDTISVQPDPSLPHGAFLDALALVDHPDLNDAFSIGFAWRGPGAPSSQYFEIYDDRFTVVDSGFTRPLPTPAPEPTAFSLDSMMGSAMRQPI
jgi:hypothetical protein